MELEIGLEFLIIMGLASFRLTRIIVFDRITEAIRAPFFDEQIEEGEVYLVPKKTGVKKWIGELLNCYWCTGVWASAMIIFAYMFFPVISVPIVLILAIAGLGGLIEAFVSKLLG